MGSYYTLQWVDGALRLLDQRRLPHETVYVDCRSAAEVAWAIREMVVRGAPAIGVAAAYGMALAALSNPAEELAALRADLAAAAECLRAARPTAVNLGWAVERLLRRAADPAVGDAAALRAALLAEAQTMAAEDIAVNRQMGRHGLPLVPDPATIIHHCNTGALATVDYGTALGVIRTAYEHGRRVHVYVDETRPRLQGARLTAWELQQLGIPFTVIADGASGHIMRTRRVDLCLVGCDRVAANGDTANKIGTYNLALAAYAHGVPFYVVGPTSTIDLSVATGDDIPIEERAAREVTHIGDYPITPAGAPVANPAFDVTPAKYITAIVTERGVAYPPFTQSLAALLRR